MNCDQALFDLVGWHGVEESLSSWQERIGGLSKNINCRLRLLSLLFHSQYVYLMPSHILFCFVANVYELTQKLLRTFEFNAINLSCPFQTLQKSCR